MKLSPPPTQKSPKLEADSFGVPMAPQPCHRDLNCNQTKKMEPERKL